MTLLISEALAVNNEEREFCIETKAIKSFQLKLSFTVFRVCTLNQCDLKKLPNVYKSCPK